MKQTMMNTAAGALAAVLLGGAALAQGVSEGYINEEVLRGNHGIQQHPTYHGPTAAEIRAWEQREAEVQARIAHFRATPYWMAIAYDFSNHRISGDGGYYSEQRAVEEALRRCGSSNCQLVATFANSCAVVVEPDTRAKSLQDLFVATDVDDRKAAVKAMKDCEAKHGNNQCSYWEIPTRTGKFCTGYDYGVYGQQ